MLLCVIGFTLPAQQNINDSLSNLLKNTPSDTSKIILLNILCEHQWYIGNYLPAKKYNDSTFELINKKSAYSNDIEKKFYLKQKANALNNLAIIQRYQGDYPEALKNHFTALKIREHINDLRGIARSLLGIGSIYNFMGNKKLALDYKLRSKKISETLKDSANIAKVNSHIGQIYFEMGDYTNALEYQNSALLIYIHTKNMLGLADAYNYIGLINEKNKNYKWALDNYHLCLVISSGLGSKEQTIEANKFLGSLYVKLKKPREALKFLNAGLALSKQIGTKEHQKDIYKVLTTLDSSQGNFPAAFQHFKLHVAYRDSLVNQRSSEQVSLLQSEFDNDKKEQARVLKEKEKEIIREEKEKRQSLILTAVLTGLALMCILFVVILKSFKQKQKANKELLLKNEIIKKQKKEVDEKQKDILDSIRYAKRIQQSLLPTEKYIHKILGRD
ncbi:MAG: tetratricopeptide repeat protein [Bacteroidetes bacterium]|nr:tetratricopeptide repeat protein [Bacteroidota bacterium]